MSKPWAGAICLALWVVSALASAPTAVAACPNEALRVDQGTTALPGCRALEMVTPPKKFAQPALLPSFSRDGQRVQMLIRMALANTPGYQHYEGDSYLGLRGTGGWELAPTSPLAPVITAGGRKWGGSMALTPDFDGWALIGSTQEQYQVGVTQLFGGGLDGSFEPLSPLLVPIDDSGSVDLGASVQNLGFSGASDDLTATVIRVTLGSTGYLPGDPRGSALPGPGRDTNSYVAFFDEAGEPDLELLARDKDDIVYGGLCGAHLGGSGSTFDQGTIAPWFIQGAISPDGDRIFFSTRPNQLWDEEKAEGPICDLDNGLRVLRRVATSAGPVITEIAPGGGGKEAPGDDLFQAASANGEKVYFLSPRKLTASDTDAGSGPCNGNIGLSKGCDLYLYDESRPEGDRVVLTSDGPEEASVLNSATAISGDGSRAYFVAQGVLTPDTNPEGASPAAGAPNFYLYDAEAQALSFIATLSAQDASELWNTKGSGFGEAFAAPVHGSGPEEGGDGHIFAFASKAPVTADDLDGGFRDVFRYDAEEDAIERISKAAPGGSDNGPFDAFVNPAWAEELGFNFNEATRWVSEDGELVGFATKEALLPSDEDEAMNPYLWEGSILGAAFAPLFDRDGETRPPAVAPVGGQVVFSTSATLLSSDTDVVEDIYLARPNGGFAEPEPPEICNPLIPGDCEGPPTPKPGAVPAPADGANVKPKPPKRCKKGFVKRKGKCVKKKQGKGKGAKRANRSRGGRA